jgi:predicted NAD/FAD-binding protein
MPFEHAAGAPKKIAVIGAGISGMGAAHMLADTHRVVLFEAEHRLGGHARTIIAGRNGDQPVDTGFIVFNKVNYPHLVSLFEKLNVPITESNMSFGASINGGQLEYGLKSVDAIFAQRMNAVNPRFVRMVRDILRFNAKAVDTAQSPDLTIAEFLDQLGVGSWFGKYYLYPLSGAIWSTPIENITDFPARAMVKFFENHALLAYTGQHQWWTVKGGSIEYVRRLDAAMRQQGVDIRLSSPIDAVRRLDIGVEIKSAGNDWELFDEVVFATHSDDSLRLLSDPSADEQHLLGAVKYQPNQATLHADTSLMPKRRKVWSSWVYTEDKNKSSDKIDLTYWMNSLQPIPHDDPHFVTLNTTRPIREELIYDQATFRHPVYTLEAFRAQEDIRRINGTNRTWFCGAWMKNGFHEDGFASAVDVVKALQRQPTLAMAAE